LIKEENKLYQKLRALIRQKNKEILEKLKKLDRIPSSDIELKALLAPLAEAKEEYNNIVMENTQEAIRVGMTRTVNELKKQGLGKSIQDNMKFILNGSLKVKKPKKPKITIPAIPTGLDFDEFSEAISELLRKQTFIASEQTIDRMTGNVMDNLKGSYEAGYGIDKAAGGLNSVFDNMQGYELERVARTEINGAQNRGAEATMLELGIQYDMWRTAGDERVRGTDPEDIADHVYLDGQISRVGGKFSNGLTRPGDRTGPIAEWINCFIGDTLIDATETKRVYRRFYKGKIITIKTSSGNELSGTPNHPILTSKGWIPLGNINNGDKVISTFGNVEFPIRTPNNNYVKTSIEEIYASSSKLSPVKRVINTKDDFHTDGRGSKEVDIITKDIMLRDNLNISISQFFKKFIFSSSNILSGLFSFNSHFNFLIHANLATSDSIVSFCSKSLPFSFGGLGHSNIHSLRPAPTRNIRFSKVAVNNISGNIKLGSKGLNRFTFLVKICNLIRRQINIKKFGINKDIVINKSLSNNLMSNTIIFSDGLNRISVPIKMDNIINTRRSNFNGHVYNLQTKDNFYVSNNIITHNCRCTLIPYLMPEGFIAPAMDYFYESDLIRIT